MQKMVALIGLLGVVAAGCMRRPPIESLHVGMPRDEVISRLGSPDVVLVNHGNEAMMWEWDRMGDGPYGGAYVFAQITDGQVVAYGDKPITEAEMAANAQMRAASANLAGAAMISNAIAAPRTVNHQVNVNGGLDLWVH